MFVKIQNYILLRENIKFIYYSELNETLSITYSNFPLDIVINDYSKDDYEILCTKLNLLI